MATALLTIDGKTLPTPTSFTVKQADLDADNSGRSETGTMQRQRVRANVAKIAAGWSNLTEAEVAAIREAVAPEAFGVDYFFGNTYHALMYVGDRDCTLKAVGSNGETIWDMNADMIEY
ncbi:MAG: hypothetical protein PHO10_03090 [Gemmiger sp.]|nr:hypothetical protein [Gemmiger sp.]